MTLGVTPSRYVCVRRISLGGEGNALYPVLSSSSLVQAKTVHIPIDTIPPNLPQAFSPSHSVNLQYSPVIHHFIFTFIMFNYLNPPLLITKLTGSNPTNSLSSATFFLSFSINSHIHLIQLISVLSTLLGVLTFINQASLPHIRQLHKQLAIYLSVFSNSFSSEIISNT